MKLGRLNYFTFPDQTVPNGNLSRDLRAQACWYFYLLAEKQREKVGNSIDDQFGLEEEYEWMDTRYVQTAKTVALMYGLESPDEFAKAWDEVRAEARANGLPAPHSSYTRLARVFIS